MVLKGDVSHAPNAEGDVAPKKRHVETYRSLYACVGRHWVVLTLMCFSTNRATLGRSDIDVFFK